MAESQQAKLARDRLPLVRAAAFKNFDVKVVDPKTGAESPFDLHSTNTGCYLNIRWKAPPSDQKAPNAAFPTLKRGQQGVKEHIMVRYLDPASTVYELHSYAVSNLYGNNPIDVEFERTKIYRGLWTYIAFVEWEQSRPVEVLGQLNMFWAMILHFHRTGNCLPRMEERWVDNADYCVFDDILRDFAHGGLARAVAGTANPNKGVHIPSHVMSFVLYMNRMMASGGPPSSISSAQAERFRNNVDFTAPVVDPLLPHWWVAHNELWTSTLKRFIVTGVLPCSWLLKEAGCKCRNLRENDPNKCNADHTIFVADVKKLADLLKRPFTEQMETTMRIQATGQGITVSKELLGEEGSMTIEQRQNGLKEKGNEYVKKQDYTSAILMYDEAIKLAPNVTASAPLYSNRSLCNINKCEFQKALADAEKCISLKPSWFRGHLRRGAALEKLDRFDDAIVAYQKGASLDASCAEDVKACVQRCNDLLALRAVSKSKSATRDLNNDNGQKKGSGQVSAVLFPCDPSRRPYEVKIPSDIIANAAVINALLGITPAQEANFHNYIANETKTLVPPNHMPDDCYPIVYGFREWLADYQKENKGKPLPFAFQAKEVSRGENNNKSDLVALINPQSRDQPNMRMCAILTKHDGGMNLADGNPATCKCRGDALIIRFNMSQKDKDALGVGKPNSYMAGDVRTMDWSFVKERLQVHLARAQDALTENGGPDFSDESDEEEFYMSFAPELGVKRGVFIEISAILTEVILDTKNHYAVDFTYPEYDSAWGIFTQLEVPKQMITEAFVASGGKDKSGSAAGAGGRGGKGKKKGGRGGRGAGNDGDNHHVWGSKLRLKPSTVGPFYSTTLLGNNKQNEQFLANLMKDAMNHGNGRVNVKAM